MMLRTSSGRSLMVRMEERDEQAEWTELLKHVWQGMRVFWITRRWAEFKRTVVGRLVERMNKI